LRFFWKFYFQVVTEPNLSSKPILESWSDILKHNTHKKNRDSKVIINLKNKAFVHASQNTYTICPHFFFKPPSPFRNVKPYSKNPYIFTKVRNKSLTHSPQSCYGFCERSLTCGDIFLIWYSLVKTTSIHSFILRLFISVNFAF
jgi:hypothetical protein